ncbi:hypothetical protein HN789_04685 [archaeon]|nr:hypothetical protein [archaeon]
MRSPFEKHKSKESQILILILTLFFVGTLINISPTFIGKVIREESIDNIELNNSYSKNSSLDIDFLGNITSLKISGQVAGTGFAKIFINEKLILDTNNIIKSKSNLITGLAITNINQTNISGDLVKEIIENNITENDSIIENNTIMELVNNSIIDNETIKINISQNVTPKINLTLNISINDSRINKSVSNISTVQNITNDSFIDINISQNITLNLSTNEITINQNITLNLSENISEKINETIEILPQNITTNLSENISQNYTINIKSFNNYCEESCYLNLPNNSIIKIEINNVTLNLTLISYSYFIDEIIVENLTQNISINVTLNETLNTTINDTLNLTLINEAVVSENYSTVEINKPVEWKRIINTTKTNKTILPKLAFNISSRSLTNANINGKQTSLAKTNKILDYNNLKRQSTQLEGLVDKKDAKNTFNKLTKINQKLNAFRTDESININENITIEIENSNDLVELNYFTDAPSVKEKTINNYKKQLTVSSDIHYENVLTYTNIIESKQDSIKVYWIKENKKELFEEIIYLDTNNNGLIDKLQWITPHLSNQTFEISITVLNPITYLRDGETWIVAFNTTGIGNLTISSTNAGWSEFLIDNENTFDEMQFLTMKCGEEFLLSELELIDFNNTIYNYSDLNSNTSLDIEKLKIVDYECNETGYLSNYMIKAGYATLLFEFSNQNMTVSDVAIDPETNITTPNIIPSTTYTTDDLICNFTAFNSTNNITNWYKNNNSIISLNFPFEAHSGDESATVKDYYYNQNNGTVYNDPVWESTGGIVGGAYRFYGDNDLIDTDNNDTLVMQLNCTVNLQYYDIDGAWTINASILDLSAGSDENLSETFSYGSLQAMTANVGGLTFGDVSLGQQTGSSNDPFIINNTGNQNFTVVNITAYDLVGEDNADQYIGASSFTINATNDALGQALVNETPVIIKNANLSRDFNGIDTNASLYVWVDVPSSGLSNQNYTSGTSWLLEVFS